MASYGLIVFFYILWAIETFALFILYFLFIWEGFYFSRLFEDARLFFILLGSIVFFIIVLFSDIPGKRIILTLCVLVVPYLLSSMEREERAYRKNRIEESSMEIESLKERLRKSENEPGLLLRLGYLYKETGDPENALKYLKKAKNIMGDDILLSTEREIKELEYIVNREKKEKTGVCRHCGASMQQDQILCKECMSFQGQTVVNYIESIFKKTSEITPPIIIFIILFLFSIVMFAVFLGKFYNIIFYILLIGNIIMIIKKSVQEKI